MPPIPPDQVSPYGLASQADVGDDLGALTLPEFSFLFKMCHSLIYSEARAKRLKLSKVRSRTIITRSEARRYQKMLEDEAVTISEPAHLAKARAEKKDPQPA